MDIENTKDTLILIKSVEKGFPKLGTDVCNITPLGTQNRDGEPTWEQGDVDNIPVPCEADASFVKSKAYLPAFEILFGQTTLGFKTEPDKIDSQDTARPKDYVRGHDVYSGNLSFDKPKDENRLEGATDGMWNPDKLSLEPYKYFRWFEIWVLRNPKDALGNICMNMNAVKCDMLVKHFYVLFDSLEESDDSAIRLTLPVTRRYYRRLKKHVFATARQEIYNGSGVSGNIVSGITMLREHSRVNLKVTDITGTGTITIKGLNICKQPTEQVFTGSLSSLLSEEYFDVVTEISISPGITSVDLELYDYDYTIRNPDLA